MVTSSSSPVPRVRRPRALAAASGGVALVGAAALLLTSGAAHAQRGAGVLTVPAPRYDTPMNFRPVEPATEVGAELAHPFFSDPVYGDMVAIVARPYFGFRLRSPWEIYFTIPVTYSNRFGGLAALGNIEVMAFTRLDLGRYVRMAIGFGGFAPTSSGFNGGDNAYRLRYEGLFSTGGYMPGYYTPGYTVAHFHLGFAWNPGGGLFTLSWEIGNEARIRLSDNRAYYRRPFDVSLFGGVHFAFRVHRVLSLDFGARFYDWITQNDTYSPDDLRLWAGSWSGLAGLRFHAGAFEPAIGVIFLGPGLWRDNYPGQGATFYADLRARWY